MCRRMLPLNALRSFEVAARQGSLTRAADELAVTPSAIHYQVKALEEMLGVTLFQREGRNLALTNAATASLPTLEAAFDLMTLAFEQMRRFDTTGVLKISVCPAFAAKWLVHRFDSFRSAFPDIEVSISAADRLVDFSSADVDLAIHYGVGHYPGLSAERLMTDEVFPVCHPSLVEGGARPLTRPAALAGHVLLHDDSLDDTRGRVDWTAWLRAAGAHDVDAGRGPRFDSASLVLDAARAGRGVALGRRSLTLDDLASGDLVRPFTLSLPVAQGYWVVCPQELVDHPKVAAFREWLFAETSVELARHNMAEEAPRVSALLPSRDERRVEAA